MTSKLNLPYRYSISLLLYLLYLLQTSCAALTETQVSMINKLAVSSDTIAIAPSVILSGLSEVRMERGIYYASSLSSAENQWHELNAVADFKTREESDIKKADQVLSILNSYLRALRSISSDQRWKAIGTELRGIGRNIDSLIIKYNSSGWGDPIPVGWAKTAGKISAEGTEWYMRGRQAKAVREFVATGDSLLNTAIIQLTEIIKKGEIEELIEHEYHSLRENYLAYLNEAERRGESVSPKESRHYIALLQKIEDIKSVQSRMNTSLQALRRAHNKATENIHKKTSLDQFEDELIKLNNLSLELATLIKKL